VALAAVSLCDTCRAPGACCTAFTLNLSFDRVRWKQEARKQMKQRRLPFYPIRPDLLWMISDETHIRVAFNCRKLGADGRCTDYSNRPATCSEYPAGLDPLCAEHVHTLKGIPIRSELSA
jgi:Fe-S-cluster containining protein